MQIQMYLSKHSGVGLFITAKYLEKLLNLSDFEVFFTMSHNYGSKVMYNF